MTATVIFALLAIVLAAGSLYLGKQNEKLMKSNAELLSKNGKYYEMIEERSKAPKEYYVLTASRYDDSTLNDLLGKQQKKGWEFCGIRDGFIILSKDNVTLASDTEGRGTLTREQYEKGFEKTQKG